MKIIFLHTGRGPLYEHSVSRERGQHITIRDVHLPTLDPDLLLDLTGGVDLVITRGFDFSDLPPEAAARLQPCIGESTVFVRFEKL